MPSRASPKGANIGRCSYYTSGHATGLPDLLFHPSTHLPVYPSTSLPIYQSTSLPVYPSTSLPASDGRPLRGRSLQRWAIRRFVGQALLTLRLFKFAPFGDATAHSPQTPQTPQPTDAATHRLRSPHEKTLMTDLGLS